MSKCKIYKTGIVCTYNVTLSHVHAKIFAVESSNCYIQWYRVCSLRFQVCNAYARIFFWGLPSSTIFLILLQKRQDIREKLLNFNVSFDFVLKVCLKYVFCQKSGVRYNKNIYCSSFEVAQWLCCCATNRKVAGSSPAGVIGFFIDTKSFRSHYSPGVDLASNKNEYQEHFLGVKAAGA